MSGDLSTLLEAAKDVVSGCNVEFNFKHTKFNYMGKTGAHCGGSRINSLIFCASFGA